VPGLQFCNSIGARLAILQFDLLGLAILQLIWCLAIRLVPGLQFCNSIGAWLAILNSIGARLAILQFADGALRFAIRIGAGPAIFACRTSISADRILFS
jgi:hypothetical protein